jgi:hypothetical protein
MDDEDPSLYHVLKLHKRRETRMITQIQDADGTTHTTFRDIAATFVQYLVQKSSSLEVDPQAINTILQHIRPVDPQIYAACLERPITTDEVHRALSARARRKTPGIDGICFEFYFTSWTSIQAQLKQLLNEMFLKKHIIAQKKRGILICLPKTQSSSTPDSYRTISLINTEYKLLARVMAHRIKPIFAEQLSTGQYCGIPGRSILDALATLRDVIAYNDTTRTPLCLLSLDFRQAFDRISHDYLFQVLLPYRIGPWFVDRLQAMYDQKNTSVQINGTLVGTIAIHSGIWQGCPLNMCLNAMCLHPLLRSLEESLPAILIVRRQLKTTVIA